MCDIRQMTDKPTIYKIAILSYEGAQLAAVLGLADLLTIASGISRQHDGPCLDITVISHPPYPKTGFEVIILPPNISGARGKDDGDVHMWLRACHASGTILCSACAGAFWLGHAGLLAGRPATTHWALEEEFQTAFPTTMLGAEHLLIDDNDIVTAGGLMAWLDLGLFIVNRFLGGQVVSNTARHLLIDPGGREQRNYRSFRPALKHGDSAILKVQHWLEANTDDAISVVEMAKRAHLSSRTFLRRFKAATNHTPNDYLQNLRIEKARGLLERTRIPVSEIGWRVGYRDPSAFGRLFRTTTGLTASDYRNRFGIVSISAH